MAYELKLCMKNTHLDYGALLGLFWTAVCCFSLADFLSIIHVGYRHIEQCCFKGPPEVISAPTRVLWISTMMETTQATCSSVWPSSWQNLISLCWVEKLSIATHITTHNLPLITVYKAPDFVFCSAIIDSSVSLAHSSQHWMGSAILLLLIHHVPASFQLSVCPLIHLLQYIQLLWYIEAQNLVQYSICTPKFY